MIDRAAAGVKATPKIGVPFAALPLEVMGRRDLTAAAKLVFAAIANHARMGRGTDSTLTNAQLAEMVGMTAGSVRRPLDELRAAGLVQCLYGISERVRTAIRVTFAPSDRVATQSATPAPKVAPTAQHGGDPGRGVVAIPIATPFLSKREASPKTGSSIGDEQTKDELPMSAEGIAAAIEAGRRAALGEHADLLFDAAPTTSPAKGTHETRTPSAKPSPARAATTTRAAKAEPRGGLDLRRVGVSAVAAAFSPAFGAVRNTPEGLRYQSEHWRELRANLSPAPPRETAPPTGERPAILPNPPSRGALANPGKL